MKNYRANPRRIRAFQFEWNMRETFMKLKGYSDEEIALHRREILHMYSLTEEDLKGEQ